MRAFSLNYWAINLGFAIAPVLGGLLASLRLPARCSWSTPATTLVFARAGLPAGARVTPGGAWSTEGERPGSMADVLRDRVFLTFVLLTFCFAVVFMQHLSTLPVQMGDDGLSPSQYGAVIALNGALIVLVTVPLTRWLQAYPRSRVLAVSCGVRRARLRRDGLGDAASRRTPRRSRSGRWAR